MKASWRISCCWTDETNSASFYVCDLNAKESFNIYMKLSGRISACWTEETN